MSNGKQIIFKQLFQEHEQIRIPMLQRDYAQGRPTAKEVRDAFLDTLKAALEKPADDPSLPLNLDFVYGSVEKNGETRCFQPLDGQQRLTTLFLLHWYLAWRDEQGEKFKQLFLAEPHSRFAYSVRQSSTEFFDALIVYQPDNRPEDVQSLADLIRDQSWYFRNWRLDPTIQAVLHMLDAIHERFAGSTGLFDRLLDDAQQAITFQLLNLDDFGLSDDLYIKMNARGKPLTAFETFKARYEQVLKTQFAGTTFPINEQPLPVVEYVALRLDTTWADLFWKLRDKKSNLYDEAVMNIFRAVALVTRNPDKNGYLEDVSRLRDARETPTYTDFGDRGWLDEAFTLALVHLLDAWSRESGRLATLLPDTHYFDEAGFFNRVATSGATLPYADMVQFVAYVLFVDKYQGQVDTSAFQEWMRVVYNLAVNTDYNRADDFRRSMVGLKQMLAYADDIVTHFAETAAPVSGFSEPQIAEEQLKAGLILAQGNWRTLIDRAEAHGYFRGQIGFLLDFSGAIAADEEAEPTCWDVAQHTALQESFSSYYSLAEQMFSDQGLKDLGNHRWQRALLTLGDYLLPQGRNYSFLVDRLTTEASWKRLLRGTGPKAPKARSILKQLWGQLSPEDSLSEQLDAIIAAPHDMESWQAALVHCPSAFAYCHNNAVRRVDWYGSPDTIYLMKRSQMNGEHAELFTYCLYQKLVSKKDTFSVLEPSYVPVNDTYSEPHLLLSLKSAGMQLAFWVECCSEQYWIYLNIDECDEIPNLEDTLQALDFDEMDEEPEWLELTSDLSDIEETLMNLDQAISDII